MNNMKFLEEFSGCSDQTIVKGKRNKRPIRPPSSASSSGGEFNCNSLVSSPEFCSGISTSTEKDEEMANCLILLARGRTTEKEMITRTENKFNSRKFTEIAAATTTNAGKVGIYVYECKTCNRTFPSFQALGGHRAGHKKPKPTTIDVERKKSPLAASAPEYMEEEGKFINSDAIITLPISTQLLPNKGLNMEINKPKIHECSICGSEFASGQALGGHMRRHRSATNSNYTTKSAIDSSSHQDEICEKTRNMLALDLDLNLPAPPEVVDRRHDREFHDQFAPNQQPRLVFSAAALVDCHY